MIRSHDHMRRRLKMNNFDSLKIERFLIFEFRIMIVQIQKSFYK